MFKVKDLYILLAIAIFLTLFFSTAGTITSGYHNTDDHEILDILKDLSNKPYFSVIYDWIENDLNIRYRPFYFVHRITEAAIFHDNFLHWSIYNIILCIATFSFLFKAVRNLDFSIGESLLFLAVSFIGPQMEVWWMLGPNETIGVLCLSVSFYFLSKCKTNYTRNSALFTVFLTLASLSKESFTIIIPGIILFKIWNEMREFNWSFREALLKNKMQLLSIAVLGINLAVILFYVGTNKIGYAGVDPDFIYKLKVMARVLPKIEKYLIILGSCLVVAFAIKGKTLIRPPRDLLFPFLVFGLILLPNIVLHAKGGLSNRYYIPATVGFAILTAALIREIRLVKPVVATFLIIGSMIVIRKTYKQAREHAINFAIEGKENNELLASILQHHTSSQAALIAADPVASFEATSSVSTYLNFKRKVKLYGFEIEDKSSWENDPVFAANLVKVWREWFKDNLYKDMPKKPEMIIFLDRRKIAAFFEQSGLRQSNYVNKIPENSRYALLMSK